MRRTAKIITYTPHLPFRVLRRFSFILTALVLVIGVVSAQAQHRTYRVPFREINHRILVDVDVSGKPATLLLDTGAQLSVRDRGRSDDCELRLAHPRDGTFALACGYHNFTNAYVQPDVYIDGLLGNDLLSKFAAVRIDFRNRVIELGEQ